MNKLNQPLVVFKTKGFTLIELLIAMAIVAVLASIAIPAYLRQVQETRRADAKQSLLDLANRQEKFFLANNQYGRVATFALAGATTITTPDGDYTVSDDTSGICDSADLTCFAVRADIVATAAQQNDDECNGFLVISDGRKTSLAKDGEWRFGNDDPCW